jgi:hypothetical protein
MDRPASTTRDLDLGEGIRHRTRDFSALLVRIPDEMGGVLDAFERPARGGSPPRNARAALRRRG